MVPLEYTQKHMQVLGFCPKEDGSSINITYATRAFTLWIFCGMSLIPSCYFVFTHMEDTAQVITSLIPLLSFVLVPVSYVTFFLEGKRAVRLFAQLRTLANERK